jgi:hypothetical protein
MKVNTFFTNNILEIFINIKIFDGETVNSMAKIAYT